MKKAFTLLLTFVLVLSLCACAGANNNENEIQISQQSSSESTVNTNPTTTSEASANNETEVMPQYLNPNESDWVVVGTVDEFGDAISNGETVLRTTISGNFSNTATSNSELDGYVFITQTSDEHYTITFRLLEYGDRQATFISSEEENIVLKYKIDDKISEHMLNGTAPNSDLTLGFDDTSAADNLFNLLHHGIDVRCIIYIGSSQYNFTISSAGFIFACCDAGFTPLDWIEGKTIINNTPLLDYELQINYSPDQNANPVFTDYFYDNQGRIEKTVASKGTEVITTYCYNEDGQLTETVENSISGGESYKTETSVYNADATLVEITSTTGKQTNHYQDNIEYDENGNMTSLTRIDTDTGNTEYERHYDYTYDATGNILTKTLSYSNQFTSGTMVYEYTYNQDGQIEFIDMTQGTGGSVRYLHSYLNTP